MNNTNFIYYNNEVTTYRITMFGVHIRTLSKAGQTFPSFIANDFKYYTNHIDSLKLANCETY
jgi:hypothetical protein